MQTHSQKHVSCSITAESEALEDRPNMTLTLHNEADFFNIVSKLWVTLLRFYSKDVLLPACQINRRITASERISSLTVLNQHK